MKNPGGSIAKHHTLEVVSKSQPLKHNGERELTPAVHCQIQPRRWQIGFLVDESECQKRLTHERTANIFFLTIITRKQRGSLFWTTILFLTIIFGKLMSASPTQLLRSLVSFADCQLRWQVLENTHKHSLISQSIHTNIMMFDNVNWQSPMSGLNNYFCNANDLIDSNWIGKWLANWKVVLIGCWLFVHMRGIELSNQLVHQSTHYHCPLPPPPKLNTLTSVHAGFLQDFWLHTGQSPTRHY